jgi:hypothetical protein
LIYADKLALRSGVNNFCVCAANSTGDSRKCATVSEASAEWNQIKLIGRRSKIKRHGNKFGLRLIELYNRFISLFAVGFDTQSKAAGTPCPVEFAVNKPGEIDSIARVPFVLPHVIFVAHLSALNSTV